MNKECMTTGGNKCKVSKVEKKHDAFQDLKEIHV